MTTKTVSYWTQQPTLPSTTFTGILFLHQNFGRFKTKLLYRCVPTNKNDPVCVIPYHAPLGFFKKVTNKYVLFHYVEPGTYPGVNHCSGQLDSVFGNIDDLHSYYDYLLHSKSLFFNNAWSRQKFDPLSLSLPLSNPNLLYDISSENFNLAPVEDVFTIDSKDTIDFDDALQFQMSENGSTFCVSVYITCVAHVLVKLFGSSSSSSESSADWIYLLQHFASNASTVYLPHRRIPMLIDAVSKQATLSAQSSEPRLCIVVRFSYDWHSLEFLRSEVAFVQARVRYNWDWQQGDLYASPLHEFTRRLNKDSTGHWIEGDSRNTVAYWMIRYNQFMTEYMQSHSAFAWFRGSPSTIDSIATPELVHGENLNLNHSHPSLKFMFGQLSASDEKLLVPMTNPMRRCVDLFNQFCLLFHKTIPENDKLLQYFHHLIPLMNQNLKSITKVQRNCRLLDHFQLNQEGINNREYTGIVFHKQNDPGCARGYFYSVFFRDLGVYLSYKTTALLTEGKHLFRLYYFKDALQTKQKICISCVK